MSDQRDKYTGGQFLHSDDLLAAFKSSGKRATTATIREVIPGGTLTDSRKQRVEEKCLAFEKSSKVLVLNTTNHRILRMNLGVKEDEWIGSAVTLVVRWLDCFGEKDVPAIRVWPDDGRLPFGLRKNFGSEEPKHENTQ